MERKAKAYYIVSRPSWRLRSLAILFFDANISRSEFHKLLWVLYEKMVLLSIKFGFRSGTSHYEASILPTILQVLQSTCRYFYLFKKHSLSSFSMPGSALNRIRYGHSSKEARIYKLLKKCQHLKGAVWREVHHRACQPNKRGVKRWAGNTSGRK